MQNPHARAKAGGAFGSAPSRDRYAALGSPLRVRLLCFTAGFSTEIRSFANQKSLEQLTREVLAQLPAA